MVLSFDLEHFFTIIIFCSVKPQLTKNAGISFSKGNPWWKKENKLHVVYFCLLNPKLLILSTIIFWIVFFWSGAVFPWEFYMFEKHKRYFEHHEIHRKKFYYILLQYQIHRYLVQLILISRQYCLYEELTVISLSLSGVAKLLEPKRPTAEESY